VRTSEAGNDKTSCRIGVIKSRQVVAGRDMQINLLGTARVAYRINQIAVQIGGYLRLRAMDYQAHQ
jgi:hypothetical protein